jgi:CheY-like chemotaxis protein/two-component sensor histidine kinase
MEGLRNWKWTSLLDAAHDLVEEGFSMTNARYVFFAKRNLVGELEVIAIKGGPPPEILDSATQIPMKWQNKVFGVMGKTRNTRNWTDEWVAKASFILGALWFSSQCWTHQDKLLSIVAHEVRNPLTGILNTVDLLLNDDSANTVDRKHFQTIEENALYLLSLSNDLLELHRLNMNTSITHHVVVNIREVLQSIIIMCSSMLTVKISIHNAVPLGLLLDEMKFKQILINLIQNSKKFAATMIHIRVAWKTKDETLYIEVEDNGKGIAPEHLPKVFEFGFSTSGGIGLGLALSKSLLVLMQGNIRVKQSALQVGTTMAFWLHAPASVSAPIAPLTHVAPAAPASPEVLPSVAAAAARLLVVDDHEAIRTTVAEMLKKLLPAFTVDMAVDGEDAVKQYIQRSHQLIFLDLRMPNVDGWECAARIRQLQFSIPPTIFVVSAYNLTDQDKMRCKELGIHGFIRKPFKIADLRMLLKKGKFLLA